MPGKPMRKYPLPGNGKQNIKDQNYNSDSVHLSDNLFCLLVPGDDMHSFCNEVTNAEAYYKP